ncbi:MAG: GntR family transcriptional regulator [Ignavibacteriales bacterium]|nr:GntR family transcriptional regulator [Ignavibacteriales bacterium]
MKTGNNKPKPIAPLKETLAKKAYAVLEKMILTLELHPGSVVTERELIHKTGFGRTPLREALLRLEREQLVKVISRKGIAVSDVNLADYVALLEARRVLDHLIAEKAAKRATPDERKTLKRIALAMDKEIARKNLKEFMRLDHKFDELLWLASHNPYAVTAVKPMHAHCRRFWFAYKHSGDLLKASALHAKLMKAIASGDIRKAGTSSDELLNYLERFTKRALELS